VAIFFFLSGYGLWSGLKSNPLYMHGFLRKRVGKILIPYWITDSLFFVISKGILGVHYSLKDYILSMTLIQVLNSPCWYIQELIIFYLIFWISCKNKRRELMLCLLFIFTLVVMIFLKVDDLYFRSALAFPMGIIWREKKNDIDRIMESHFLVSFSILSVLLGAFFSLKYLGNHMSNQLLFEIGNCFSAVTFCAVTMWCLKVIRVKNKLLVYLGGISYEIFLLHYCALRIIWHIGITQHPLLLFTLTFLIVIPSAILLNLITRKIWNKMR